MPRKQKRAEYFAELVSTTASSQIESAMVTAKIDMATLCLQFNRLTKLDLSIDQFSDMVAGDLSLRSFGVIMFLLKSHIEIKAVPITDEHLKKADVWASR